MMTTAAWAFAAVAAVFALTDWWAVVTERMTVRYVAKPATLAALIGVAITLDPSVSPAVRAWMVAGLVFSLGGDVFLMLDEKWFVAGLASFLVGHLSYIVAMQLAHESWAAAAVGAVVVALGVGLIGTRVVAGVASGEHADMKLPVIGYLSVISVMVISAFGTAAPWAIAGALLFYASDATLAWNRFLTPFRHGNLAVMVTYHLAQASLVAWLVTG